jgi:hypothetical protein
VTRFNPEQTFRLDQPMDKHDFEALVDERIGNPNLIAAVRFTGLFEDVHTRTVFCQCRPYPKMLDGRTPAHDPLWRNARPDAGVPNTQLLPGAQRCGLPPALPRLKHAAVDT